MYSLDIYIVSLVEYSKHCGYFGYIFWLLDRYLIRYLTPRSCNRNHIVIDIDVKHQL